MCTVHRTPWGLRSKAAPTFCSAAYDIARWRKLCCKVGSIVVFHPLVFALDCPMCLFYYLCSMLILYLVPWLDVHSWSGLWTQGFLLREILYTEHGLGREGGKRVKNAFPSFMLSSPSPPFLASLLLFSSHFYRSRTMFQCNSLSPSPCPGFQLYRVREMTVAASLQSFLPPNHQPPSLPHPTLHIFSCLLLELLVLVAWAGGLCLLPVQTLHFAWKLKL